MSDKNDELHEKSFEQLVKEKATCSEFAWYGYIRFYKEDEKPCDCQSCKKLHNIMDEV